MSENQSENQSKNQPKEQSSKLSSAGGSKNKAGWSHSADGLVVEDVPRQMTMGNITPEAGLTEPNIEEDDAWDVVSLPGTVNSTESTAARSAAAKPMSTSREQELLTLIHDLNNCNDVLLGKVSKLEAALSESQQSVRAEVEKAQTAQEKMLEQVLEQQSAAQQTAQTAQQQVAKLVGQLDTTEQTLQRQQLIQETLEAELNEAQERINQLERECALTTQQHADEAQARIKAETTNRDLRSRLQRQQRYTLQFKAALEKSLTVTGSTAAANPSVVSAPVSFNEETLHSSVTMPRAERIIPWNAIGSAPFAGIDPHLENLIRDQADADESAEPGYLESKRSESVRAQNSLDTGSAQPESAPAAEAQVPVVDIEAETKLWQDLERVMGIAAKVTSTEAIEDSATDTETVEVEKTEETAKEVLDGEPRLNWQAKSTPLPVDPTTNDPVTPQPPQPQLPQPQLSQPQLPQQSTGYLPLIDGEASAVSPVVNPLRTQRKIGSMAAVQLPTFEKAKAGSFKR